MSNATTDKMSDKLNSIVAERMRQMQKGIADCETNVERLWSLLQAREDEVEQLQFQLLAIAVTEMTGQREEITLKLGYCKAERDTLEHEWTRSSEHLQELYQQLFQLREYNLRSSMEGVDMP